MATRVAERGHQYFVATAGVVAVAAACATTRCRSGHCTERSSERTANSSLPTCASLSSADDPAPQRTCTKAPWPVRDSCASAHLQLSGSPVQRGALLGKELGDDIRAALKTWRQEVYIRFAQAKDKPTAVAEDVESWAANFVANFLESTEYASSIDRWAPGALEELRGIATSAAVSYDELLCMQHRAECDRYGESISDGQNQRNEISTSVAVCGLRKTGCPALLAQSVELEPSRSDRAIVLQITPGEEVGIAKEQPATLLPVHAGMIAPLSGLNACGVAVSADLLPQLTCSSNNGGLAAGFAVRAALAMTRFEDAIHVRASVGTPDKGLLHLN